MKTFTKQIEEPRLIIQHDEDAESPRACGCNIGHFFTKESRYHSPDGNMHALYQIMIDTADEASNLKEHIKLIEEVAHVAFLQSAPKGKNSHDEDLHIVEIYPVYRYEHRNVFYKRGTAGGFDYSNCGFYIVTAESLSGGTYTAEDIAKAIDTELEEYSRWCNGEVWQFTLYDENGVEEDSQGGFCDIEDIRERLPDEWKGEKLEQYIK